MLENAIKAAYSAATLATAHGASPGRAAHGALGLGALRRSDAGGSAAFAAALDVRVLRFLEQQAAAGYEREWGMVHGCGVNVEEDTATLVASSTGSAADAWEEVAVDPSAEQHPGSVMTVYSRTQSSAPIRPHLASISMLRNSEAEAFEAVANLRKYGQWDMSFQSCEELAHLDVFTQVCQLIGDPPPPPFSYMFPQRDFVVFRHSVLHPAQRFGCVIVRNGAHGKHMPDNVIGYKYVRAEVLGTIGFLTRPIDLPPGCLVATQADGAAQLPPLPVAPPPRRLLPPSPTAQAGARARGGPFELAAAHHPPGLVRPPGEAAACHVTLYTSGDPKGNIPSFIINAVAKRTPRKWCDRLTAFCDKERKRAEDEQ
jgi:hypothetical protein